MSLDLDTTFEPAHGRAVDLGNGVARITAPNAGPMTFHGTNSYLVGRDRLVLIDPGPADPAHRDTLLQTIGDRPVDAILVTHTHLDHTGLAAEMSVVTNAPLVAQGPHRAARDLGEGEVNRLDAASDRAFHPDITLADDEILSLPAGRFRGVHTPGHTANHMCFALEGSGLLFSGDHVMAWSTSIVAPPDGSMTAFMASLERLLARDDRQYLPGHGGPVGRPRPFVRALRAHRRMRESAILDRIRRGDVTVPGLVAEIYKTTDRRLHGAAALSVLAHLEDLAERGLVRASDGEALSAHYTAL